MEPHELAIAALNEVVQTALATSHRDPCNNSNATTESDIVRNKAGHTDATAHRPSASLPGNTGSMPRSKPGQEDSIIATSNLKTTTSNNSQSTTDGHETASASTPPTSTSDEFSSQSTIPNDQLSQLSQLSQIAAEQEPWNNPARPTVAVPATAGQKRTADGQVKSGSSMSPVSPQKRGHSRTTSAISNASSATSRIGELSSELRTRLSYAMVKVNNGWQSHSIDEVESLASQAGSPTSSSTSTLQGRRNIMTSPRTAIANVQGRPSPMVTMTQPPTADFDLYSRHDQTSGNTYESFWRNHSTTSYPVQRHSHHSSVTSPPVPRGLAPPADIRPTQVSRRSSTPKFSKPPTMPGHGSNSPYNAPRTPHRETARAPPIQTQAQKTIQEQDAIETLLFMSSPGNSGNMAHAFPPPQNHATPQQSPLRAEFSIAQSRGAHGRRVEFDTRTTSGSAESSENGPEYRARMSGKGRARGAEIDRMLDEMGDTSSDEEDLVITYSSPRRVAAGRV